MKDRTNEDWLHSLQGSDRDEALSSLRIVLLRGLRGAISRYEGVTAADLEDFVQEALLKILANLASSEGRSRFTTWAHKIAVRVALTELRRRRWRDVSIEDLVSKYDDGDFTPAVFADPAGSADCIAAQQILLDTVLRLVDEELTDRQRQAMLAIVVAGMPLQDVADRMGTSRNALYKLMHDARRRLKRRMADRGLTPDGVLAAFAD